MVVIRQALLGVDEQNQEKPMLDTKDAKCTTACGMSVSGRRPFVLLLTLATALMSEGCATHRTIPERFASLEEVYPSLESYTVTSATPGDSYVTATFAATKEETLRALTVAMANAHLNVESVDKAAGVVLASESGQGATHYYAAKVGRGGAGATLQIVAKTQRSCKVNTAGGLAMITIVSFGVIGPVAHNDDLKCEAAAAVHWATRDDGAYETIRKLLPDVRTKLYASGAM